MLGSNRIFDTVQVGAAFFLKDNLRKKYRQIRAQIPAEQRAQNSQQIIALLNRFQNYKHWLLYASTAEEFPTRALAEHLWSQSKCVYFPKVLNGNEMRFFEVESWTELEDGKYCLEPLKSKKEWSPGDCSIAIVPGLCFSRDGHRIGYGAGYYDRFLNRYSEILRVGLCFQEQIALNAWNSASTDAALDWILCPNAIWGSARNKLSAQIF